MSSSEDMHVFMYYMKQYMKYYMYKICKHAGKTFIYIKKYKQKISRS